MTILRNENSVVFLLGLILFSHFLHWPAVTNIAMMLLGILSIMALNMPKRLTSAIRTLGFWSMITFFLFYVLSLTYSQNMEEGTRSVTAKLPLLVFPIMFSMLPVSSSLLKKFSRMFPLILSAFFLICLGIQLQEVNATGDQSLIYSDNLGSVFHIQAVYGGLFVNLALIFILFGIVDQKENSKKDKVLYGILAFFLFALHFLLISRLALILGLLILAIFIFKLIWNTKKQKWILPVALGMLLLPFLAYFSSEKLQNRFQSVFHTEFQYDNPNPINHFNAEQKEENWNSFTARLATWTCAWEVFKKAPIVGQGVGDHFDELMKEYEVKNYVLGLKEGYNTHNQYLDILLACGILGLLALLLYFFYPLFIGFQSGNWLLAVLALAFIFSALTENILNRSQGIIVIAIVFSLYQSYNINQNKSVEQIK
ncbi:MAG: O-antigen ligase family protein [Crocinitomicaceae bacterium]|nr:O-antigen ligase family protein [Crocinitomicaceae bacterium]